MPEEYPIPTPEAVAQVAVDAANATESADLAQDSASDAAASAAAAAVSASNAHDSEVASAASADASARSAGGSIGFATRALLNADLAHAAGSVAWVTSDPTLAYNGMYLKSGASGTGAWTQAPYDRVAALETRTSAVEARDLRVAMAPAVTIGGRSVIPTWISFDGYVTRGVYADTMEPYEPLSPLDARRANTILQRSVMVPPVTVGGRTLIPSVLSFDGYVLSGTWADTGETYGGGLSVLVPPLERSFPDLPGYSGVLTGVDVLGVIATGQSNSIGLGSNTLITASVWYAGFVKTFTDGPLADPETPASMASWVNVGSTYTLNGGTVTPEETPVDAFGYQFLQTRHKRTGVLPTAGMKLFLATVGISGKTIGVFAKGAAPATGLTINGYNRYMNAVTRAKALANAAGLTYAHGVIIWDQGESTQGFTDNGETYAAQLRAIYNDMVADIKAITGQTWNPIMLIDQKNYLATTTGNDITLSALLNEHDGIFVTQSDYTAQYTDDVHRTAIYNNLSARLHARAAYRILGEGKNWQGIRPVSAWTDGLTFYARFSVPVQPLAIDYARVGATTQAGFKINDASGDVPLTNIGFTSDTSVVTGTMGRLPTGPAVLRYGLDFIPAGSTLDGGVGGNLRDSDLDFVTVSGAVRTLANWCPSFSLPLSIPE